MKTTYQSTTVAPTIFSEQFANYVPINYAPAYHFLQSNVPLSTGSTKDPLNDIDIEKRYQKAVLSDGAREVSILNAVADLISIAQKHLGDKLANHHVDKVMRHDGNDLEVLVIETKDTTFDQIWELDRKISNNLARPELADLCPFLTFTIQ